MKRWVKRSSAVAAMVGALMAANGVAAETKVAMHLDWLFNGYHAPFVVAVEKGWYEEAGLDVTVRSGKGSFDSVQTVGAGNAEFGFPDAATAAKSISEGVPLTMVAVFLQQTPMGIVSFADKGIEKPADLEGRKLSHVPIASTGKVLPAFLNANGVDLGKVTLVEHTFATAVPSVLAEDVDAGQGYVFGEYLAIKNGAPDRKVNWIAFADNGIAMYSNGIAVNNAFLAENPEAVRAFVQTSVRALEWTLENPDEAIDILATQTTTKKEVLREQLEVALPLFRSADTDKDGLGTMTPERWKITQDIMVQYGGQEKAAADDKVWTTQFLK